jgi:enoyl-CoA hydratase/carnithine racemase
MSQPILTEVDGAVGRITLNRPDAYNAITVSLAQALEEALLSLGSDAKLSDIHANHGMVPGGGSTQRLPRLVGVQRALGLILSGDRLSGTEAVEWGLAYRAFPGGEFESGAAEFARKLAAKDGSALARTKRLIRDGLERPLADGIALELETVLEHLAGPATFAIEAG